MINTSIWDIDILNYTIEEIKDEIQLYINFSENIDCNFYCNDPPSTPLSFIEKLIYSNIEFHSKKLNIDLKDTSITFWTKRTEYDFGYIHMHKDHCDYEARVYGIQERRPLFTSLIYFDDNDTPTLVTDISDETNFMESKQMVLSFPKFLKNIVFDSGKYYHGESYLSDYKLKPRKTIVIALWKKEDKPLYVPVFDSKLYYYYSFVRYQRQINYSKFENVEFVYKSRDTQVIVPIKDFKLINKDFFNTLIIKKDITVMYRFYELLKNLEHDTIILNYSEILNTCNYENMNCHIELFKMNHHMIHLQELYELFNEREQTLNHTNVTILEKYVTIISEYHINKLNLKKKMKITFNYAYDTIHSGKNNSLFTIVSFFQDGFFCLTDSNYDNYKYKIFDKMLVLKPNKINQVIFSGEFSHRCKNALIINLWDIPENNEDNIKDNFKDTTQINELVTFKQIKTLPQHLCVEDNIFEEYMYNKKDMKFEDNHDLLIFNNKEREREKQKNTVLDLKINKLDFPY